MKPFGQIVRKNREYFSKQKESISDQKTIDLSTQNISLGEVVEFIVWSATEFKKIYDNK